MQKIETVYLYGSMRQADQQRIDELLSIGWVIKEIHTTPCGGTSSGAYMVILLEK